MTIPTPNAKTTKTAKKPLSVRFKGRPRGHNCNAIQCKAIKSTTDTRGGPAEVLKYGQGWAVNSPSKRLFDDALASVAAHTAAPTRANYRRMLAAIRKCRADPQGMALLCEHITGIVKAHKRTKNT